MRALITGASSGIGRELARCFARDGYDLVITARSQEPLDVLAAECREQHGITVDVVTADLSRSGDIQCLTDELVRRNIGVAYLVNNAGFGTYGPFLTNDLATELSLIQVNIAALTELSKRFLPAMVERKHGRILNIASTASFQACPLMAVYAASKAYVLSFSEALAHELRGSGVTVTCYCPGPTETAFGDRSGFAMHEAIKGRIPSAQAVAQAAYEAMFAGQTVAVHGMVNRLLTLGARLAPRTVVTAMAAKMLETGR